MQVRLAFLVGWLSAYFLRRPTSLPESLCVETRLLREEIQAAREAIDHLGEARRACEWEVWGQKWLLRVGGIVDLVLILWMIWARFALRQRDIPLLPSLSPDTGGSSSDTEPGPVRGDVRQRVASPGQRVVFKG